MSRGAETEIKLEVRDLRTARKLLKRLGLRKIRARHFESNELFDFADLSLWRARCLLRLRRTDRQWLLTFKRAPLASRDYKIRREIETVVAEGKRLQAIFEALGLRTAFRYEKYRSVYGPWAQARAAGRAQLVLDETPIGVFLELEGPPRWIDRVAAQLGYRREDYITASYASLYRQKCQERGIVPTNMVFTRSKS